MRDERKTKKELIRELQECRQQLSAKSSGYFDPVSLYALIDHTSDSICSVDSQFRLSAINRTFKDLIFQAFEREIQIGDSLLEIVPPEMRALWKRRFNKALRGEKFLIEERYQLENKSFYMELSFSPICYNDEIRGVSVIARDIADRKKIEKVLRDSETRFRNLVENVPSIAVHGYDMNRQVIFWNNACERTFGYSREEAMGTSMDNLILPPELQDRMMGNIENFIHLDQHIPMQEIVLRRKNGMPVHVLSSNVVLKNTREKRRFISWIWI